jgi:hypothetical protein
MYPDENQGFLFKIFFVYYIILKIKTMGIISEQISGDTISVAINSSNLKFASYNTTSKTLTITFNNGSIYEYYNVPWIIFTKFRSAESQGRFFNTEIGKIYKYKKVK